MIIVTYTEIQNNFSKYLQAVQMGDEVIILKNGNEVARIISKGRTASFLTDSLVGVLKDNYNEKKIKEERISRYESID